MSEKLPVLITLGSHACDPTTKVQIGEQVITSMLSGIAVRCNAGAITEVDLTVRPFSASQIAAIVDLSAVTVNFLPHETVLALAPWTQHRSDCKRVVGAEACSCGLQEMLAKLKTPKAAS